MTPHSASEFGASLQLIQVEVEEAELQSSAFEQDGLITAMEYLTQLRRSW